MEIWLKEMSELLHRVLGSPVDATAYMVLLCVAVAALFAGMQWIGRAAGIHHAGAVRSLPALFIGVLLLMAAWIGSHRYLLPFTEDPLLRKAIIYGAPLLMEFMVVAPLHMLIIKASYQSVVITFLGSLLLTALMIMAANATLTAVRNGESETHTIESRNNALKRLIDN